MYDCESWSLILRGGRKQRMFENRVLRISGPNREEVKREFRKSHNEELNHLYSSANIFRVTKSRKMRWAGRGSTYGREKRRIQSFGGEN